MDKRGDEALQHYCSEGDCSAQGEADFEEHLMSHFKEKQKKEPLILKKRKHKWSDQDKDDGGPRKVAVIDLFTIAEI